MINSLALALVLGWTSLLLAATLGWLALTTLPQVRGTLIPEVTLPLAEI